MTIEQLADAVRSNFKTLQEGEIIARIMIISGRSFSRSLTGYKLLCEKGLLKTDFITFRGIWEKILAENPLLLELFDRWDCVPGKVQATEFQGFKPPRMLTREEAIKSLNLPHFENAGKIPDF